MSDKTTWCFFPTRPVAARPLAVTRLLVSCAASVLTGACSGGDSLPAGGVAAHSSPSTGHGAVDQPSRQADFDSKLAEFHAAAKRADESTKRLQDKLADNKHKECTEKIGKYLSGAETWLKAGEQYKAYVLLDYCRGLMVDEKAIALHAKLDASIPDKDAAKRASERKAKRGEGVRLGMSQQDVLDSSWGKPSRVNRTIGSYGTHEQWVYGSDNYLYFQNGVLTTIQN